MTPAGFARVVERTGGYDVWICDVCAAPFDIADWGKYTKAMADEHSESINAAHNAAVSKAVQEEREAIAKIVESGIVDVVYRYTPFPHNRELTKNPLSELAEAIRSCGK